MNILKIKKYVPISVWDYFRAIYRSIIDGIRDIGPYVRSIDYCGITLYYNKGNNIIQRLKNEPVFEEEMCANIVEVLRGKEHPRVIDVGANIGLVSTYILSKVPSVKIYAFEPGPVQREMLQMTVDKNGLEKYVSVYPYALGKENGVVAFYTHNPRYVAGDGLVDTGRARKPRKIDVTMLTLDAWWIDSGRPHVDVVKMDTEGAELLVLGGAADFVSTVRPTIYLEIEPRNLKVYPYTHMDILHWLEERKYSLMTLGGNLITEENFQRYIGAEDTYVARGNTGLSDE